MTLKPGPDSPVKDLKLVKVNVGAEICTATSQSATNYTFSIDNTIADGQYKITGTDVNELTITVTVTQAIPTVKITAPSSGNHYT